MSTISCILLEYLEPLNTELFITQLVVDVDVLGARRYLITLNCVPLVVQSVAWPTCSYNCIFALAVKVGSLQLGPDHLNLVLRDGRAILLYSSVLKGIDGTSSNLYLLQLARSIIRVVASQLGAIMMTNTLDVQL